MIDLDELGDPIYCAFVEPKPGAKKAASLPCSVKGSRNVAGLKQALEETLASNGEVVELGGRTYTATPKNLVRERFDAIYGGSEGSNRKALKRALDVLITQSELEIHPKNGEDWIFQPDEVGSDLRASADE
jgi:hypothetical protein